MNISSASVVDRFTQLHVLILGDAMLDRYIIGEAHRICREAPVPVMQIRRELHLPGGAANAALNAAHLGARVTFISAVGDDAGASLLEKHLLDHGIRPLLVRARGRRTICKTRFITDSQIVFRADESCDEDIDAVLEQELFLLYQNHSASADVIIFSDNGCGLWSDGLVSRIAAVRSEFRGLLAVDSRRCLRHFSTLQPTAVKPNRIEAAALLGMDSDEELISAERVDGERILELCAAQLAAVTLDKDGALIFERGKPAYRTYSVPVQHSRASGAGDTYLTAFALSLAAGAASDFAGQIAATAASIVVGKEYTAACSKDELRLVLCPPGKLLCSLEAARMHAQLYRSEGKRLVMTTGCFDMLHAGSISTLLKAKSLGAVLFVGLNSDDSVRMLKGPGRPLLTLNDRIKVLEALSAVDHVVPFPGTDARLLVEAVRPDIFVKGGNYREELLPEADEIRQQGGEIVILPLLPDDSTSRLINRIRNSGRLAEESPAPSSELQECQNPSTSWSLPHSTA